MPLPPPGCVELICSSAFSFSAGASTPEELVDRAVELGLRAIGLTDRDGVYGLPRAWRRVKELREKGHEIDLVCGARVTVEGGPGMALLAQNSHGWAQLCRMLTAARCGGGIEDFMTGASDDAGRAPHRPGVVKGWATLPLTEILSRTDHLDAILLGAWSPDQISAVHTRMGDRVSLALTRKLDGRDPERQAERQALSQLTGVPLLATHDVRMHDPARHRLYDVQTCIRRGTTIDNAGRSLAANSERHLRGPAAMRALYKRHPDALQRASEVASRCTFSLDQLAYQYPREVVPDGHTPNTWLRALTATGLARRYPHGAPRRVRDQVEHELALIDRMQFPAYFLTVYDAVRFAREQGILCQGRGSAANSAVCYALGITSVDPASSALLFERFISEERGEPPDIDVDFEHERREEVIQYIYKRYGRHRAAMVCNIITYRRKSALRDVGKALGLSLDQLDSLTRRIVWFDSGEVNADRMREAGLDPKDPRVQMTIELASELRGLPRHVGIHSGGFTISDGPLVELVPIEPATMSDRTVLQWDKDDLDVVGFIKVDVLALGMLTAIQKSFDLVAAHWGRVLNLALVPNEDAAVFDMLCVADTVGVFQIESRAQMSMLPRLKPRTWYDLVIEVSLVRPGPIQGGMVHPYLARRNGDEPVIYAHPGLKPILERTLGIPIFQEQVMAMAVAVGGFTPGEADHLRRAMGAWRKRGGLAPLTDKLMAGMAQNGITAEYAEQICKQIQGFGDYGFPESHGASFARLVYVSAWLKCHYPAAFTCALLNSQPMGFYSPRSLLDDARRHGVEARPVDVRYSGWDHTLEPSDAGPAIRVGFRLIKGLREDPITRLMAARESAPFRDIGDLARRANLGRDALGALARADALKGFGMDRRQALWSVEGLYDLPLFRGLLRKETAPPLPQPTPEDHLREDYRTTGVSLAHHPTQMIRPALTRMGLRTATQIMDAKAGDVVRVAGIVSNRQRPGTASGVLFMTLEDETGMLNLVVWPRLFERQRALILGSNLLRATARVQRDGAAISLLVLRFAPLDLAPQVPTRSRDFR